ncbi:MAG: hypothetical protein ABI406_06490 [Ktedonobacteraceae bacterium]
MQNILQRFKRLPRTPTVNQVAQFEELLANISKNYFDTLVELETSILIRNKEITSEAQSSESGGKDYLRLFKEELTTMLQKRYPDSRGTTIAEYLHLHYFEMHKSSRRYETLEKTLKILFREPGEVAVVHFSWAYPQKDIPTYIAYALQNILITAPRIRGTFADYGISNDVRKCLEKNLRHIEKIRVAYNLPAPLKNLDSTRMALEIEIARANKMLWLPIKPLIMAPLSQTDDLRFNVREPADEENLARQIIKNDGVILVTGYRGVGKSTFVEATFAKISTIDAYQNEETRCKIVKIQINLAKSKTTYNVLRQCLRAVCHTLVGKPVEFKEEKVKSSSLQQEKPLVELLTDDEKQFIKWAYLRACYKVNFQKDESMASLRHIETALGIKPSDLVPKPYNTGWSFFFGMNANKEWSNKVDRTIAMLDYDEDQAEDDLIHIIEMLARPRKLGDG